MTERIDELQKYYTPIEVCDKWAWRIFIAAAVLSVSILYLNLIQIDWVAQTARVIFIVLVVAHSIFSHYNGFHLIPIAENLRRRQLLSDSFGVPLTPEQTHLYYNNEVLPSIVRLGVNVMENSFFAKNVCNEMAKIERKKVLFYTLVWLLALFNRSTDLNLLLTLTQVLFSGDILIRYIKIELLRARNESIYDKLYSLYLNRVSPETDSFIASILDLFASYEAAKSAASIKQSTKIFNQLNSKLTSEWVDIRARLNIGDNNPNDTLNSDS